MLFKSYLLVSSALCVAVSASPVCAQNTPEAEENQQSEIIVTGERVARGIRSLRYHGIDAEGWHRELGYNSQMPSLTAAMLLVKLRHFDEMQRLRGEIASEYLQGFRDLPIAIPRRDEKSRSSWHKFVIRSDRRNDL